MDAIKSISLQHVEKVVLYFVLATVAGHYLEIVWLYVRYHLTTPSYFLGELPSSPIAEPYGFGVLALLLIVVPIVQKRKLNIAFAYALSVFVTGLTEYICAVVLVLAYGHNAFWDYSHDPFNLQGYVCLETSLWFGLAAIGFIFLIHPAMKRFLASMTRAEFDAIVLSLGMFYLVCRLLT